MPMRQLRTCDFCGDAAAGVYEVLPPELSPTDAEQHRVVLCSECVGTLEAAMDPLLRRLGVDTGDEGPEHVRDTGANPPSAPPSSAPDDGPVQWDTAGPAPVDDTPTSDPVYSGSPDIDPADGTDPDSRDASASPETGRTNDVSDPDGADAQGRDTGADGVAPGDEPEDFRTVMRLLGNREFPVDRDAIVELAASAYELDEAHVHGCLDYAVNRGVLDDDSGMLQRGERQSADPRHDGGDGSPR